MMNRGLGAMFYGRRPVQYMRNGGVSSGRGSYAGYDPVAAATGRATGVGSTQPAQVTREVSPQRPSTTATVARSTQPAQVTREPSSYDSMQSRESSWRDDRDDLSRAIADSYAAEAMANAALGRVTPSGISPNEAAIRSAIQGATGSAVMSRPDGGFAGGSLPAAPVSPGLSRPAYGDVAPVSPGLSRPAYGDVSPAYVSPVVGRPDITSLLGNIPTAGLSQPAYAGVSSVSPAVTQGVTTAAAPSPVPSAPTEGGGFFGGIGKFFSGMYNDLEMGLYLLTQGEQAFIEKYGADALADYRRRSAETAARTAAEEAARGDDSDVFEACPEGYERDPVTQMCVPVPVKGIEEEEEEEEETTTTTTGPTPGSGETIQEVIDRITFSPVGSSVAPTVTPATTRNVLPNVDFFGLQRGPRRMADGGAVDYRAAARAEAEKFGLRPDMFERMILRESNFDPMARSRKGALGLAQVMPATARDPGFGVAPLMNPLDPNESLRFGAEYLSALLREFGGDEERALAAYNAGVGRVRAAGGVPDIAETRDYVDFILRGRGPVEAPPPRPADLGKKAGPSKAAVSRAVAALTPERRASVPVPPMPSRPSMSREERMSQLQGGMGGGDSLSRAVDSVLSSLMR